MSASHSYTFQDTKDIIPIRDLNNAGEGSSNPPPPSYEDAIIDMETPVSMISIPSAPPLDEEPNAKISIDDSTQPLLEEENMFAGRPPPPDYSEYIARFTKSLKGVRSYDSHLNEDTEALYQFLMQHNDRPSMSIDFYGYHEETKYRTVSRTDRHGRVHERREQYMETITDFKFSIDASNYISSRGRVYVLPDKSGLVTKSVRDICNDYVRSTNLLKELHLKKEVEWDYSQLTQALTTAIRYRGFHRSLTISYPTRNDTIIVRANTALSEFANTLWVKILCFISFLWLIFWPIIWFYRQRFGEKTLRSEFRMEVSTREWYERHIGEVISQVKW